MTKRKNGRIWLCGLLGLAFSLVACGGGGGGGGSDSGGGTTGREWTYMVYMGADNNLSSAGEDDITEMAKVGSTSGVAVVVQAEFSQQYSTGLPTDTRRMLIQKGVNNIAASTSIGNVNMADPAQLTAFIKWAQQTYPAKRYALVIWDHGAGWKTASLNTRRSLLRGAVQDETSDSFMSLPDLAKAVRDSGVHFDLINFDACLMAMYEVAYEFKGLVDYLVFSEETEPGDGDPYDTILNDLKTDPAMTGRTLATTIVNNYYNFYVSQRTDGITKSAVDMSKLADLDAKILQLSANIVSEFSSVSGAIASAQAATQKYTYTANHDLYAFCDFLSTNLPSGQTKVAAAAVKAAVDNAVVANKWYGDKVKYSHGIAIYSPTYNEISSNNAVNDLAKYALLACNQTRATGWYDAVLKMSSAPTHVLKPGGFAFYISWDTDADLDLYVWEPSDLYAAWMGKTTPNGFFSGDSYETGISEEFYVAKDYVEAGDYDVIINYFGDGVSKNARVTFWWIDPSNNVTQWQKVGPVLMNLMNAYNGDFSDITSLSQLNAYNNWWYTDSWTRSVSTRLTVGERAINIRFGGKKTKPAFTNSGK